MPQKSVACRMSKPVVDSLETVKVEAEQRARIAQTRATNGLIEPIGEQQPVGKFCKAVMMREEFNTCFRLSTLGDVLVGTDPAAIVEGLMIDRDKPTVAQLLKKSPLLTPIDESLPRPVDFIHAAPRIVAQRTTVGKHIVERHARTQAVHRLFVYSTELFVNQSKPIM